MLLLHFCLYIIFSLYFPTLKNLVCILQNATEMCFQYSREFMAVDRLS